MLLEGSPVDNNQPNGSEVRSERHSLKQLYYE